MQQLVVGVLMMALISCAEAERPPMGEDTLVLELGGPYQRLADALRVVAPRPEPEPSPEPEPQPEPAPQPDPEPDGIDHDPRPGAVRWVELEAGQTVSDLSREHLGASGRWREVLELNGWTERQARRLRIGTRVKLPPR